MKRREVLCIYGFSEAETQQKFSSWLSEETSRKILVLEEKTPLQQQAWQLLLAELQLVLPPHLTEEEKQKAKSLFEQLQFWQMGAEGLLSDVKDQGKQVVSNLLANLSSLQGSLRASSFANRLEKVPAIICGAGPSLDSHLSYLNQAKGSALLFAGGSSMAVLFKHGITPHFTAALDPNPPEHLFESEATKTTHFFFPLRVASWLLPLVKGTKVWAADGISYPLEDWLTSNVGLEEPSVEGGWNVATFCMQLAALMGCDPIILVGVDLALPEGRSYAEGVEHEYKKERLIETPQGLTKSDFLLAADWIEIFRETYPDRTFYNVSKEAWKIPGVVYKSLEDILPLLPKSDLAQEIEKIISKAAPIEFSQGMETVISAWENSVANAKKICDELLVLFEKQFPFDPRTKGEYVLKEVELEEEPVFRFLIEPIWEVWRPLFEQPSLNEPFEGFHAAVQRLLFWKNLIVEMQDAAL